jgi:signal transduction histidine kinase
VATRSRLLAHAFNDMAGGLEERTKALVAVNESRRQLLADVSHELMTPLAAIRGYVETMSMPDVKLDDPNAPALSRDRGRRDRAA